MLLRNQFRMKVLLKIHLNIAKFTKNLTCAKVTSSQRNCKIVCTLIISLFHKNKFLKLLKQKHKNDLILERKTFIEMNFFYFTQKVNRQYNS
jgi:hypothetical protein